jgi:2-polyprenyl-6-methoxyphenol hydroxylase-like FAD-dependent oxidoreductase
MEILRGWGLEHEVLAGGVEVEWLLWRCETLATARDGVAVPVGLPTRAQAALVSPTAPACVPQDHLERALLAHLRSLATARVELGVEVVGVASRPDGVRARLRDRGSGASRVVRADHLIAADGAHSAVRRALRIPMRGPKRLMEGANAVFRAPLWELAGEPRYGIYGIMHPEASGVFLPAGPADRWAYGFSREPGSAEPLAVEPERLAERIRLAAGVPDLPLRIERTGAFAAGAQLAERFRHERTFLVGDAAHPVTPRGGTGMNTAIHDGFDLGWKLAWVLRGWAAPGLLDTYERERRPVAEHNVARSADPNGTERDVGVELHADLGGRIPHVWIDAELGRRSTLDLLGPGLTLLTGPDHPGPSRAAVDGVDARPPLSVHGLDAMAARALGIRGDGALLVRPDGLPAGSLAGDAEASTALRPAA